jgi:hypothetical protein
MHAGLPVPLFRSTSGVKKSNYNAYARRNVGHFESTWRLQSYMHYLQQTLMDPEASPIMEARVNQHPPCAPMWMDGALMGVPFSSLPVPGLTKVVNSS